jgi:cytochrome c biogenesis protein CcmG/thiol:disulfide interchange protein DsbE
VLVGPRVTVAALHGRPAAINFWASWCEPCRREAPGFARLPGRLGERARIVGVDWNDGERNARAFIRRFGWRYPNLRDVDGLAGDRYGLAGLPTTYILDRRGRIVSTLQGPQTARTIEARLLAVR